MQQRLASSVLVALVAAAAVAVAAAEGPEPSLISTRAHQLFLALDANGDHRVSRDEATSDNGRAVANVFFPHSGGHEELAAFVEVADTDGDSHLSEDELQFALHSGLRQSPAFLELDAVQGRVGFLGKVWNGVKKVGAKIWNGAKKAVTGFFGIDKKKLSGKAAGVSDPNEACVLCQYIIERAETNVKTSGVLPGPGNGASYAQAWANSQKSQGWQDPMTTFLEVDSREGAAFPGGGVDSRRAATHELRVQERAKYNQIYKIMDATLDDVCEQSMPPSGYQYCKAVYAIQADIVDGLRYQYRPSDICYKVGMCAKGSYITTGMHNQKRFEAIEQAKKQADLYETCNDPMTC